MFTALSASVFHLDRQGCAIYITYTCAPSRKLAYQRTPNLGAVLQLLT
jgi:hypothetical protein